MAKKKGKKADPEKKAALLARKEAKADKATLKRLRKEGGDENVDSLLEAYAQLDLQNSGNQTLKIIPLDGFPPPRANATLTVVEGKKTTAYLFGGEYFDGVENIFLNQLFKVEIQNKSGSNTTCEWKQIIPADPIPAPRCAHSSVFYNQHIYTFGGELANPQEFHHYKDLWKFNIKTNVWTELKPPKATGTHPSPRSGHAAEVWKHFLIIFGGFFEAKSDAPKWYNDVTVFNLQTETWMNIPHSKLAARPEPRSACNAAIVEDRLVIHGGFSKLSKALLKLQPGQDAVTETKTHTDVWALSLQPLLKDQPPVWERVTSSGTGALPKRAGMASALYKSRLLAFGGVVDHEQLHHQIQSIFFNMLYSFDIERRKWFPIVVAGKKEEEDDGWNLTKLRSNLFAFVDANGQVVYEKMNNDDDDDQSDEETKEDPDNSKRKGNKSKKSAASSAIMTLNAETNLPEVVSHDEPLPRINACLFVSGHTLYLYGGLLEIGDRELTLDDLWSLDLKKQGSWECVWPGNMHQQVWRGTVHDDNDSYVSSTAGGDSDSEDDDDEEEEAKIEEKEEEKEDTEERRNDQSADIKAKIAEINEMHNLQDENQTPHPNESISDFYARTSDYWNGRVSQAEGLTDKDVKRKGFELAQERFTQLEPILAQLMALLAKRKELKSKKSDKKSKKKSK